MQRRTPPALFALFVGLITLGFVTIRGPVHVQAAVTYAAGWNLVSGPDGSTLTGTTGTLYTLQPGDTDYEAVPLPAPLRGGWAYWAFFPSGGSLNGGADRGSYSVTLTPGHWVMVGNPSAFGAATASGADTVLTYSPGAGYQPGTSIPAGQGAWMQARGAVSLTAPVGPPPAQTPTPTPTPSPSASAAAAAGGSLTISIRVDYCRVKDREFSDGSSAAFYSTILWNGKPATSARIAGTATIGGSTAVLFPVSFLDPEGPALDDVVQALIGNGITAAYDSGGESGGILAVIRPRVPAGTIARVHLEATQNGLTATADQTCTMA